MQTGSIRIWSITGSVYHKLLDQLKQLRLLILIWKLGREKAVYVLRSGKLAIRMEEDDQMNMWKTTLLKLGCPNMGHCSSQNTLFINVIHQLLDFEAKYAINQIWSVS